MDKAQTNTSQRHIEVAFGALAPRLHDQVGLEAGDLAIEQRMADAVVLCAVQGVLTQAEKNRAFKRIFKRIQKRVEEIQKGETTP